MEHLTDPAAVEAAVTGVDIGLSLLAAAALIGFTWLSARVKWWHVLAISVAVILLDGTLNLYDHLMAMMAAFGHHATSTAPAVVDKR